MNNYSSIVFAKLGVSRSFYIHSSSNDPKFIEPTADLFTSIFSKYRIALFLGVGVCVVGSDGYGPHFW